MKRKEQRRAEAAERQARYDAMTDEQKLDRLVNAGFSGCREHVRLQARIEATEARRIKDELDRQERESRKERKRRKKRAA